MALEEAHVCDAVPALESCSQGNGGETATHAAKLAVCSGGTYSASFGTLGHGAYRVEARGGRGKLAAPSSQTYSFFNAFFIQKAEIKRRPSR